MTKIETKEQYDWAVARVEVLLPLVDEDTPADSPFRIELELLSGLVADYSEANYAVGEPTLADLIRLRMCEMGINQKKLAELLGVSSSRISDYLSGRSEPTLKVARNMCRLLDIDGRVILG